MAHCIWANRFFVVAEDVDVAVAVLDNFNRIKYLIPLGSILPTYPL